MSELTQIAKNLTQNCGYAVFPCEAEKKRPAWGKHEGGNGFHDASTDPKEITRLFAHPRAGLIGVRTGEASGVSVLDIDVKHPEACSWFRKYETHLPLTRTYRTRGGGLHLYFQHRAGVVNSESKPVKGVDVRGEGGYVIHWFSAGLECLDQSPPTPWPEWLFKTIWPPPKPVVRTRYRNEGQPLETQLERVREIAIKKVEHAGDGNRHVAIRAAAKLLGGIQERAGFGDAEATRWLMEAAGLGDEPKATKTIAWGLNKGRGLPLEFGQN